jgi:hypothetical protein
VVHPGTEQHGYRLHIEGDSAAWRPRAVQCGGD